MTTPTPREAEREAFEPWAKSEGFSVARGSSGLYTSLGTNQLFSGWLGRAALAVPSGCLAEVQPIPEKPPMRWPKEKRVSRRDDMSQTGKLTVMLDNDNDVLVNVCKFDTDAEWESATVEFCNDSNGGGRSMRTREALIALMVAIEEDNAARPIAAMKEPT